MRSAQLSRSAGWSAYVSAGATLLGFVTLLAFYSAGTPFETLNDVASVVIALSTLPVLAALHQLLAPHARAASQAALLLGALGMLWAALLQTLLILKIIGFAQTAVAVPLAFGLFGVSLASYGFLAEAFRVMSRRLAILGILAGAGYALVIAGILRAGEESLLASIGGLTAVICYPIWAIWFGRLLLGGRLSA